MKRDGTCRAWTGSPVRDSRRHNQPLFATHCKHGRRIVAYASHVVDSVGGGVAEEFKIGLVDATPVVVAVALDMGRA